MSSTSRTPLPALVCAVVLGAFPFTLASCGGGNTPEPEQEERGERSDTLTLSGTWLVRPDGLDENGALREAVCTIEFGPGGTLIIGFEQAPSFEGTWESRSGRTIALDAPEGLPMVGCLDGTVAAGLVAGRPGYILESECDGVTTRYTLSSL